MRHTIKKQPQWIQLLLASKDNTIKREREYTEELEMIVNTYHFGVRRGAF